jgi:hypothetical protein
MAMDLLVHCAGSPWGAPVGAFVAGALKQIELALFYGRQTRRYGEQMTTQHNRIISPKADGIDQDGRPAARDVLSRSGLGT